MNSITDLINDKAEEIFPGQASTNATPAPAQDDNIIDLENYDENEIFEEKTEPEIKTESEPEAKMEPKTEDLDNISTDSPLDLEKLKSKLYSIKDQLDAVIRLVTDGKMIANETAEEKTESAPKENPDEKIIHGVFDGEKMISEDNKEYSIPPNYASKSKLVEGDTLKLTITNNGRFIYKQIKPTERIRKVGALVKDPANDQWYVQAENKKYKVEFINITHSTLQTSMIALHTDEGIVLYSNDFKLDNNPILGKKPNYERLKEIGKEGVKVMIVDSLYSGDERKTASEKVARTLLEEVMLTTNNEKAAVFVTTFSSHIARLKSIVEFGKQLNRRIIFLGRSLNKYVVSASKVDLCPFIHDIEIATYKNQLEKKLKLISKNRSQYLVVCTGHQGEPGSIMDRISRNKLPFQFENGDHAIFSSSVIPTKINIENRERLDQRLRKRGTRLFSNIHVSGHAGREDLRDFINMVNPEHIIPAHGSHDKISPMVSLGEELGYKNNKNIHLLNDRQKLDL
ncbi:MAG: hypothetical protein A2206_02920 [Candidatus Magasanikbacteria bacterium RIFOXYA1_FULL_40_8]|uniref:Uncharacterized protein n=1 Tax=Candidatus Magasanikbacteria bacterium RIFOXYA1_FULL_40_8 TaxID=1798694 RepID=A0A1F6NTK8_9BACT|nr:MAG: hypothetical protein A2206_02920 [Candidatus Magasanikbacteria bacterium RIFOXYA1_FULL_40_8]